METGSNIVMIDDANGNHRKLIAEYGKFSAEDINNYAMAYIGHHTRQAIFFSGLSLHL